MKRVAMVVGIGALAVLLPSSPAYAAKFRRPFSASIGVNYGYDNNGGGGCTDFACGGVCYDGHSGTDFPLSMGTSVLAPAGGRVSATNEGCSDWGGLGSTCGGRCGNYVRIDHQDGTSTLFCHMQNGSIAVSTGEWVSCGQFLGRSASSGNSSGPHLHFGLYVSGSSRDPFSGGCSQSTGYWVGQGSYPHNVPSASCETSCECSPGQTQTSACGNCGTRSRTCNSSCSWGSWGSCQGQGECAPGSVEERACCDCGTQTRSCSNACAWKSFSACAGPDPAGGTEACDTGEPGPCAPGIVRCVDGCRACGRIYEPEPEMCDDIDNDCSGETDDGEPSEMGDPLPEMAARLVDVGYPGSMVSGTGSTGWVVFRNEGSRTWAPGALWLEATSTWQDEASELHDVEAWPAYGVAAVLDREVPSGGDVMMKFPMKTSAEAEGVVRETFHLVDREGTALKCPAVRFDVAVMTRRGSSVEDGVVAAGESDEVVGEDGGCAGCSASGRGAGVPGWFWLVPLGWIWRRRRGRARP